MIWLRQRLRTWSQKLKYSSDEAKAENMLHTCFKVLKYSSDEAKAKANSVKELLVSLTDIYRASASTNTSSRSSTAASVVSGSTKETAASSKSKKSRNVKLSGKMADLLEGTLLFLLCFIGSCMLEC